MPTATFTKDNSKTVMLKGLVSTNMSMVASMSAIGILIRSMVLVKNNGKTAVNTRAFSKMVPSMVRDSIIGLVVTSTLANGKTIS